MKSAVLRVVGFSFLRSWMGMLFFSSSLFSLYDPAVRWQVSNEVFLSSLTALTAALLLCALFHRTTISMLQSRYGFLLGPTIVTAGTLLLIPSLSSASPIPSPSLLGSAVLTGSGSALVLLDVGRSFATTDRRSCFFEALIGTALASFLPIGSMALPVEIGCMVAALIMYLAAICAHEANLLHGEDPHSPRLLGEVLSTAELARLTIGAFVLGFATGLIRHMYAPAAEGPAFNEHAAWFFIFTVVLCLALLVPAKRAKTFSLSPYYKLTIVLCTTGFAIIPVFELGSMLPHLVFTLGYALFEVLAWVVMAEVAHRFQYTSVQVFGFGRVLIIEIGVVAGVALFPNPTLANLESPQIIAISAVSVILITLVSQYVLRAQDLRNLEQGAIEADDEWRGGANEAIEAPPATADKENDKGSEKDSREQGGAASGRVPMLKRCRIVGAHYGLTERETQVMHLFATGRTAARVQEELVISAGTVNSHAMHIYQKMGVHSRQELVELVTTADLDLMSAQSHPSTSGAGSRAEQR